MRRLIFTGPQILMWGFLLAGIALIGGYIALLTVWRGPFPLFVGPAFLVLMSILMICAFRIPRLYDDRKLRQAEDILREKCDPPRYLVIFEKLLRKSNIGDVRIELTVDLGVGYLGLNDTERASAILASIHFFPNNREGAENRVRYFNAYFRLYFHVRDFQKAGFCLEQMKTAAGDVRIKNSRRAAFLAAYRSDLLLLHAAESGDARGLSELARSAETTEIKVLAQFLRGTLFRREGREDEARTAFTYAAEHGNRLYLAGQARRALEKGPVA